MKAKYILSLVIAMIMSTGCKNAIKEFKKGYIEEDSIQKEVSISESFNAIETMDITDIEYVQGSPKFTLSAPEEYIDKIRVVVKDGILKVYCEGSTDNIINNCYAKLTVSAPAVERFSTLGIGDILINNIDIKDLKLNTEGTGNIIIKKGKCTKVIATTEGVGDIEISHLSCVIGEFNTYGTGDIEISRITAERLGGISAGTGSIKVAGECVGADFKSSGTGIINDKGLEYVEHFQEDSSEDSNN